MHDYTFFSKDPRWWGEAFQLLWGHHDICPKLEHFHVASITQSKLSSLTSLKAWGDLEKFKSDVTFLLILTRECAAGTECLASPQCGITLPSQGPYHGGGG